MSANPTWDDHRRESPELRENLLALGGGLLFTATLIVLLAHLDKRPVEPLPATIGEARLVALPPEAPPPKPKEYQDTVDPTPMPFAGIEAGSSDSGVKIAATPPELVALTALSTVPPAARLDVGALYSEIRPPSQLAGNFDRVYDRSEVDQPPHVLSRDENPVFPASVRDGGATQLRAMLIVTVGKHGEVTSAHVLNSSGKSDFDRVAVDSVRQTWVFSPGIKDGKPVATIVQQPYIVRWSSISPFSAQ